MPIARVDYNFTDRTKLYGIFAWWSGHEYRNSNGLVGPAIMGDIDNYRSSLTQVLDLTHTFSPSLIGDIRASFNRYFYVDPNGTLSAGLNTLTAGDLGLTMPKIPTTNKDYAPEVDLGDNFPNIIGNQANPNVFETYDVGPSITHILGNHSLHYGGEFSLYHDVPSGIGRPNGYFGFGTDNDVERTRDYLIIRHSAFPVHTPLFTVLLVGVILIVGALTFFPALSLGPILEHLLLHAGRTF